MVLLSMTDFQIQEFATGMLQDTIVGANNKNWSLFSRHMPAEDSSNEEIREDVERQWEEEPHLTSFSTDVEFLGVIRKSGGVLVLWKLVSTKTDEEYLEMLYLEECDEGIVQTGIWTE